MNSIPPKDWIIFDFGISNEIGCVCIFMRTEQDQVVKAFITNAFGVDAIRNDSATIPSYGYFTGSCLSVHANVVPNKRWYLAIYNNTDNEIIVNAHI